MQIETQFSKKYCPIFIAWSCSFGKEHYDSESKITTAATTTKKIIINSLRMFGLSAIASNGNFFQTCCGFLIYWPKR